MATNPLPRRPPRPPGSPTDGSAPPLPEPAAAQGPAPRQPGPENRRKLKIAAGVLSGGFVLFMLIFVVPLGFTHSESTCSGMRVPEETGYEEPFREAKNLIRAHDWAGAKKQLLEVQRLAPGMKFVEEYLVLVEREFPNEQHLLAAKAAMAQRDLVRARAELTAVGPNTYMYERRQQLERELKLGVEGLLQQAWAMHDRGQLDHAGELLKEVLAAYPGHPDALRLQEQLLRPPQPVASLAVLRFLEGDVEGAIEFARVCAPSSPTCKTELEVLKEFSTLHKKREKMGPQDLARLMALDNALAGTRSPSQPAHELVTDLREKAKELFLFGYSLKEADPRQAEGKFRRVMALTLPKDELHQKAKNWLDKLQR